MDLGKRNGLKLIYFADINKKLHKLATSIE